MEVTASDGVGSDRHRVRRPRSAPWQTPTLKAKGGQKSRGGPLHPHARRRARPLLARAAGVTYQWLRGTADAGATARHAIRPDDVGARLRVPAITVKAPGYEPLTVTSQSQPTVRHRVDVRRMVRYHVETRGKITTSLKQFKGQAQQTYDDPRGWRAPGSSSCRCQGGSLTLVLCEASRVPGFSSACSTMWSCRVGRYVIINQERWKHASPAWNAAHRALRDYRHMVVNHETGHLLGLGHARARARAGRRR